MSCVFTDLQTHSQFPGVHVIKPDMSQVHSINYNQITITYSPINYNYNGA